ncbi:MAG: hypothetical protein ACLP9K_04115 [Nitrososphaerales archaeon]
MVKELEGYKKVKAETKRLWKLHVLNPTLHDWVPMRLLGHQDDSRTDMLLGCRCGTFVWVSAGEIQRF